MGTSMADPLSSSASILAIAGFTVESTKVVFKFFRGVTSIPDSVHKSLHALQSLQIVLTCLQQRGTSLASPYHFSSHFCSRLQECLADLKAFEAKLEAIDKELRKNEISKHDWNGKARRSWERLKWLLVGEHELDEFLDRVKLYKDEFLLELLTLLVYVPPHTKGWIFVKLIRFEHRSIDACRLFSKSSQELEAATLSSGILLQEPLQNPFKQRDARNPTNLASLSQTQLIRPIFMKAWRFLSCDIILRTGPVVVLTHSENRNSARNHYRKAGFGLILSLAPWKLCENRLDIGLGLITILPWPHLRIACHYDFCCSRIIARDAEIMQGAEAGSIVDIQRLFSATKATPNDTTVHGVTPLHVASKARKSNMVKLLIQQGGNVNAQDEAGDTPLHWAMACRGNYEIVRLLIENGADLANYAADMKTPLHSFFNDTVENCLRCTGYIEMTFPDSYGMSITHFVSWSSKSTPEAFERGLANSSSNLWAVDDSGRTCLHLAAARANIGLLGHLLKTARPCHVRMPDHQGRTALHYAAQSTRVEAIDLLVAHGGDLHAGDKNGHTVLDLAAAKQNVQAIGKCVALGSKDLLTSETNPRLFSHGVCGAKTDTFCEFSEDIEPREGVGIWSTRTDPYPSGFRESEKSIRPNASFLLRILERTPLPKVALFMWSTLKMAQKLGAFSQIDELAVVMMTALIALLLLFVYITDNCL